MVPCAEKSGGSGVFLANVEAFDRCTRMVLYHLLVLQDLSIQFIHQQVDRRVQVLRDARHVQGLARHLDIDLSFLPFFFFSEVIDGQEDVGIYDLIEMANNAFQLILNVFTDGGGHFEMMATDGEVHTHSFEDVTPLKAAQELKAQAVRAAILQGFAKADGRDLERFTVFGDRPARNDHALFPEHLRDLAVG